MEILKLDRTDPVLFRKKTNTDEDIVRRELVRVWTRILEKYAAPGASIPPEETVRRELIKKGVDAAVKALEDEHWFFFSFMGRDKIQEKVEEKLRRFDLADFLEDVREAQKNPHLLERLREKIRKNVLEA